MNSTNIDRYNYIYIFIYVILVLGIYHIYRNSHILVKDYYIYSTLTVEHHQHSGEGKIRCNNMG